MPQPNRERNYLVHRYWQDGKTVDEIAMLTAIPRSTVGYYIRKFNRYARMGLEPPLPASVSHSEVEAYQSAFTKIIGVGQIFALARNEDPQTAYYKLASLKLAMEIIHKLQLSPEERKQLPKLIQDWVTFTIAQRS